MILLDSRADKETVIKIDPKLEQPPKIEKDSVLIKIKLKVR